MTFEKRHLPLSDGNDHDEFNNLVPVPSSWLQETPKRKVLKNKVDSDVDNNEETMVEENPVVMVYDADTNQLVPLISIE